jgi:hypothetical protein
MCVEVRLAIRSTRRVPLDPTCPSESLACSFLCRALFAEKAVPWRDVLLYQSRDTI